MTSSSEMEERRCWNCRPNERRSFGGLSALSATGYRAGFMDDILVLIIGAAVRSVATCCVTVVV